MTSPTPPASQAPVRLEVSHRTSLVTIDTARAVRGADAETIIAEIDLGTIPWVFNIAVTGAARRELRIWAPALQETAAPRLPVATVIERIINTRRAMLPGPEVERLLMCSGQLVKQLYESKALTGKLIEHTRHITRESLATFLHSRLVT